MPVLLRGIRWHRWLRQKWPPWVPVSEGDIPGSLFDDLRAGENKISVWVVDEEGLEIPRLVAALAAKRDRIDNFDYMLFDSSCLTELRVETFASPGDSLDDELNKESHLDLVKISGEKLLGLAKKISLHGCAERVNKKVVERYLREAIEGGRIREDAPDGSAAQKIREEQP